MRLEATDREIRAIVTTETIVRDPLLAKGYQQFQILNLFLDTLVRKDPEHGIVSGIATSWEVSKDQTSYKFNLSPNARFHDGSSILPKDVLFSFERHLKDGSGSFVASYLKNVLKEIKTSSESSVMFLLKGPYPPFLELLSLSGFGIISQNSKDADIVGSGPYKFAASDKDQSCLEMVKDYPFKKGKVSKYCFQIERDVEKTILALNSGKANLAMGSPLEVALSKELKSELVANPTFSLVATNAIFNHSKPFLKKIENRKFIQSLLYRVRKDHQLLSTFDAPLNTFIPKGIMPEKYYFLDLGDEIKIKPPPSTIGQPLKIVFPYGIFLEESVKKIVSAFKEVGFSPTFLNVKGKDLLDPILSGDYDIIFIPYQGVMADPDGYLDLLSPESILKSANLPTSKILCELSKVRFDRDKIHRLNAYAEILKKMASEVLLVPFSQNGIPLVYNKSIKIPNLNFSFHLSLRDLDFAEE